VIASHSEPDHAVLCFALAPFSGWRPTYATRRSCAARCRGASSFACEPVQALPPLARVTPPARMGLRPAASQRKEPLMSNNCSAPSRPRHARLSRPRCSRGDVRSASIEPAVRPPAGIRGRAALAEAMAQFRARTQIRGISLISGIDAQGTTFRFQGVVEGNDGRSCDGHSRRFRTRRAGSARRPPFAQPVRQSLLDSALAADADCKPTRFFRLARLFLVREHHSKVCSSMLEQVPGRRTPR
jgi:hypothetical protein